MLIEDTVCFLIEDARKEAVDAFIFLFICG